MVASEASHHHQAAATGQITRLTRRRAGGRQLDRTVTMAVAELVENYGSVSIVKQREWERRRDAQVQQAKFQQNATDRS
jgi:hypothetical protein